MTAMLEHTNYTVTDPDATARWMCDLFGWNIRWTGSSREVGYSVHVGTDKHYLALYVPKSGELAAHKDNYTTTGGLNHIAVVVDDIDRMRDSVAAIGFIPGEHHDYEPGQWFIFMTPTASNTKWCNTTDACGLTVQSGPAQ